MLGRHSRLMEGSHSEEQRDQRIQRSPWPTKTRLSLNDPLVPSNEMISALPNTSTALRDPGPLVGAIKEFLAPKPIEIFFQAFLSKTLLLLWQH